jgi:hypothetical protein
MLFKLINLLIDALTEELVELAPLKGSVTEDLESCIAQLKNIRKYY